MIKRRIINLGLLAFIAILFSSCNNPLHRTYDPATYEDDMQAIRKSNKVSEEDLQILAKYIMLTKLSGSAITGKSYEDIIDRIKSLQQSNNELNNREAMEKEAKRKRLSPFLEVSLQNKIFEKKNNKNVLIFTVILKNTGTRKIKTVTGNLAINDLMERPVKNLSIFLDEDIPPGQSISRTFTSDYDEANENDRRMRSKDFFDIRAVWDPGKIIFDGGKLAE